MALSMQHFLGFDAKTGGLGIHGQEVKMGKPLMFDFLYPMSSFYEL